MSDFQVIAGIGLLVVGTLCLMAGALMVVGAMSQ